MSDLREAFDRAIREAIRESYSLGYPPTGIEQMIEHAHPVEVAKRLVLSGAFQDGFRTMAVEYCRPDITVEGIMLRPEFNDLFTRSELQAAQWRLDNIGQD
jgi:hypothetical protein